MSLRNKAREIKAAGEAERGNFTPNGVPKRVYQYWLANTGTKKGRDIRNGRRKENFCHFWRVVAIWAPLMFLGKKAASFAESKAGLVTGILLVVGLVFGLVTSTIGWVEFLIGIGFMLAAVTVAGAVLFGLFWLKDNKPKVLEGLMVTLLGGFVLFILTLLVIDFGLMAFVWIAAILAGVAAAIFALILIGNAIQTLRAYGVAKWQAKEKAQWDAYVRGEGPNPHARPERKPDPAWMLALGRFFRGIGDFFVLLAQVVRVKKWGICPLVEIETPNDKIDYNSGWETA